MLTVSELKKEYRNHVAVDGINFTIKEGEIFGLLGPNGAGKSTTISMLSSLLKPSSGTILFRNVPIGDKKGALHKELGYVPQDLALYPEFTAVENLMFFGKLYKIPKRQLATRVYEVLEIVGLTNKAKDKVSTFSGGMKRRLNIACGLIHKPSLLFMDEPTVGIDPQSRNYILQMIKQLNNKGLTILYTSHYMEEVDFLCDRIAILDKGRIIEDGTKDELMRVLQTEEVLVMTLAQIDEGYIEAISQLDSVQSVQVQGTQVFVTLMDKATALKELFHTAEQWNVEVKGIEVSKPTLEDVFLHLTGRTLRD
ncbi:antibiotic ABC transporter ATP-binding protein [Pontibacillus halophilus JSM 076056 = DSM 19796]|uniref:Antibiotic ABC transporter ATP-binding protein n=1 Tax=Pontibacillus halophilus JSM 076056 = DSM 19796 TaxID=1385510 RepID=A0A0A5GLG2_9BACI|nr:ABC transporter ATP-binding protein [Pontibacillus halophilus]KGX92043.1 antibiotic ABC transporter ATP-binding protein [Pontibacillus halophilus JSM 076056 = DSM 19796]